MDSNISKTSRLSQRRLSKCSTVAVKTSTSQKNAIYYDSSNEGLDFEESQLCLSMNRMRRLYLAGGVIIRHYRKDRSKTNCYQDDLTYLYTIFKEYLIRGHQDDGLTQSKIEQQRKRLRRNQTSYLAQFHPYKTNNKTKNDQWLPTYAVCYEIQMQSSSTIDQNDDSDTSENVVQISFRPITRQSFLANALGAFSKTIFDETIRRCVAIELTTNPQHRLVMRPCQMSITNNHQIIDRRVFLVAKHGWLAVFLNGSEDAYLLTENEYLVFGSQLKEWPIFYERIVDTNQANHDMTEMFYRRTNIVQDQYSANGMIVTRGVIQNEYKPESFTLVGLGNSIVNMSYLQQLLTLTSTSTSTSTSTTPQNDQK
ncbi:uncharacterized protein LOC142645231 [Dermatophagoides pteronyssinus]|uniref:uncharacterized protein LOC142645231 n=1 Tax=Dermatophagoides pteronyssinus TaxID=6956 RepID=UPI003F665AC1